MVEPTNMSELVPEHEQEVTPLLTLDGMRGGGGEHLPDEWPILIGDLICRVTSDGLLVDHVTVTLPDGEELQVKEASKSDVAITFSDGHHLWRCEDGLNGFDAWIKVIGATISNADMDTEIDHSTSG